MPPKKGEPEIVEEVNPGAVLLEDAPTEDAVTELVDSIIDLAHEEVRKKRISKATTAFTVESVMQDMQSMVATFFLESDPGEPEVSVDPSWAVGSKPVPCEIDAWSRGAVQVRRREPPRTPVGSALQAANAGRSSLGTPRSSRPQSSQFGTGAEAPAPASNAVVVCKAPPGTPSPERKKKKEGAIVTAEERRAARLRNEAREAAQKLEQLQADLKGREYTYDASGRVIVLEPLAPDKLPAFKAQPRLELIEDAAPAGKKGGRRSSVARTSRVSRVEYKPVAGFQELDSLQPPLVESMVMREGVTLRDGDAVKEGGARSSDPLRMSRLEFQSMQGGSPRKVPADAAAATPADPASGKETPSSAPPPSPPVGGGKADPVPGQEPAELPRYMPATNLSAGHAAPRNAATRERGGTKVAEHLPPPMLPATAGHGLELPYGQQLSAVDSTVPSGAPKRGGPTNTMTKTNNAALLRQVTG